MSVCIKDRIQNMNLIIGCTVGCAYAPEYRATAPSITLNVEEK